MTNAIKLALIGLALGSAATMAEDCTPPQMPVLPDGASSSLEQMLEGQAAVKAYQASNTEYRACLEPKISAAEVAAAGESPGPELTEALQTYNEQYNASVSAEEGLAGKFNTELKKYKAANPG
jgi:hypothetical protein